MLDAIRYWQENDKGGLEEDVKAIDSAITFIACEHDAPGVLSEKEYRKEERMRAAMRLEELLRLLLPKE